MRSEIQYPNVVEKHNVAAYIYPWMKRTHAGRGIAAVWFERYNAEAGVREEVRIHWTQVFQYADHCSTGGLGVSRVEWKDGSTSYAEGRFNRRSWQFVSVVTHGGGQCLLERKPLDFEKARALEQAEFEAKQAERVAVPAN